VGLSTPGETSGDLRSGVTNKVDLTQHQTGLKKRPPRIQGADYQPLHKNYVEGLTTVKNAQGKTEDKRNFRRTAK